MKVFATATRGCQLVAIAAGAIWVVSILLSPALAAAEPAADPRVAGLIDRLKQGEFEDRRRAADALGDLAPRRQWRCRRWSRPSRTSTSRSTGTLSMRSDGSARLRRWPCRHFPMRSTNPRSNRYSRRVAARALGRFGASAVDSIPALVADLDAEDHELGVESALALWRVNADQHAIGTLTRLIESGKDPAAFHACLALAEIGPDARACIPTLLAALAGSDADIRRAAARALGAIGPEALLPIAERLADRSGPLDLDARTSAADALGTIADEVRRSTFNRSGASPDQITAARAPFDGQVIPVLSQLLNSDEPALGQHAARALAAAGLVALPVLAEALCSDRPPVRQAADLRSTRYSRHRRTAATLPIAFGRNCCQPSRL